MHNMLSSSCISEKLLLAGMGAKQVLVAEFASASLLS